MTKQSAGILLYRAADKGPEFFLVHPGGPFWAAKDEGAWSIPKGEYDGEEIALDAAKREFTEETGFPCNFSSFIELQSVRLKSGKMVRAWLVRGDVEASDLKSNLIEVVFKNGKSAKIPEVDRGAWFSYDQALVKINAAQTGFIREARNIISGQRP